MHYLGMMPCAAAGSLTVTRDHEGNIIRSRCTQCDENSIPESKPLESLGSVENDAILILSNLVKSPGFLGSRRPRVLAMTVIQKFVAHFDSPAFISLEASTLGQWCLQSLQSSVRELRIAAG